MAQMSNLEVMERYATLGPDFLTYLCVRSSQGTLDPPASEPGLTLALMGPMVFASDTGEATKVTLAGDEASAAPEVEAALRQGKRLIRGKVEMKAQDAVWNFTLDGETFDMKSMKLPVPKVADADEYMALRVQAIQHLAMLINDLFEAFLPIRLDAELWRAEVEGWMGRG
ncbi:MAG: hypothetical protein RLY93_14890 [Sumerlaeia bacterium]